MDQRLDSELLRTFVAIADGGSFTVAAERLGRTQSAISMQVKRLEEIAAQPLFTRHARGVSLTGRGEALVTEARRIVHLLERASEAMRQRALEGGVRVGIPEEYGATILPGILAHFARGQPGVQVTVRCESSRLLERALHAQELDLAVLVYDAGKADGEILVHDPMVWVTSAKHVVHEQDPLPVAMFDQDCWVRDRALQVLDRAHRRYRVAYTSRAITGLQAAASAGLAVTVLGASTVPAGCRVLTAADGFLELPGSSIVLREGRPVPSPAVAAMAAAMRAAFAGTAAKAPRAKRGRSRAAARHGRKKEASESHHRDTARRSRNHRPDHRAS
jgi:DNA-binding transcriptional LysR family regulator